MINMINIPVFTDVFAVDERNLKGYARQIAEQALGVYFPKYNEMERWEFMFYKISTFFKKTQYYLIEIDFSLKEQNIDKPTMFKLKLAWVKHVIPLIVKYPNLSLHLIESDFIIKFYEFFRNGELSDFDIKVTETVLETVDHPSVVQHCVVINNKYCLDLYSIHIVPRKNWLNEWYPRLPMYRPINQPNWL